MIRGAGRIASTQASSTDSSSSTHQIRSNQPSIHQLESPKPNVTLVDHSYIDFAVIDDDDLQMIEVGRRLLPDATSAQEEMAREKIKELAERFGRVKSFKTGGVKMTFPNKLMEVLSRGDLDEIICWMPHGRAFKVLDSKKCAQDILPRFFKQTQHHSFVRQLNLWGFKRITRGRDEGAYYHEMFLRGRPNLALMVRRQKFKGAKASRNPEGEPDLYKFSVLPVLSLNRPIPALPPLSTFFADRDAKLESKTRSSEDVQVESIETIDELSRALKKTEGNLEVSFDQTVHRAGPIPYSAGLGSLNSPSMLTNEDTVHQAQYTPCIVQSSGNGLMSQHIPHATHTKQNAVYSLAPISHKFTRTVTTDGMQCLHSSNERDVDWCDAIDFLEESMSPLISDEHNKSNHPGPKSDIGPVEDGELLNSTSTNAGYGSELKLDGFEAHLFTQIEEISSLPSYDTIDVSGTLRNSYKAQLHVVNSTPFDAMRASLLSDKCHDSPREPLDHSNSEATPAKRSESTSWEDQFEELKAYKRETGHSNVPKIYSKNPSLGYWVFEQRIQYRRLQSKKPSDMTEEKVKALESLGFKWGSWDNWLKELQAYKDQHGDVDVPLKYKPNVALGAFVSRQRTEYRKLKQGLQSTLNDERIKDLEAIGFNWSVRVSRTPWEERLNELKQFKEEYGHANVPSIYPENQPLAFWVFKQRGQYRVFMDNLSSGEHGKKVVCHITPERIAMLDELGFEWNPPGRIKLIRSVCSKIQNVTKVAGKKEPPRSSATDSGVKKMPKKKDLIDLNQPTCGEEDKAKTSAKEEVCFRKCESAFLPLIGQLVKAKNNRNAKAFKETVKSINEMKDKLPPTFLRTYQIETLLMYGNESFKT